MYSACANFMSLRAINRRSPFEVKDREGRELLADELASNVRMRLGIFGAP